jgi:hypothetical protein
VALYGAPVSCRTSRWFFKNRQSDKARERTRPPAIGRAVIARAAPPFVQSQLGREQTMVSIIPLSVGQRRLDTGNGVQYPNGSPVGGAMQGLGDHLSAIAERYQQMKDQQDAFDAEIARRRFSGQIAQAEEEVAANAPADGSGLQDAMYGQVDPRTGRVVKTGLFDTLFDDALPNIPESQLAAFARQKETLRAAGGQRTAQRQLQRRKDYEQAEVDTVLQTNAIAIGKANPDDHVTFEAARQDGLGLIDKMGLDPEIRQQLVKDWYSTAAKARFEALIAKEPQRALEMFGVGTPAAGRDTTERSSQAEGSSLSDGPEMASGKDDRVGTQIPDERIAQAFRDDLPQEQQDALALKANVAKFTQDIETRVAIGRAEAEAPDEIARTGVYSGGMPGKDAYRTIYGLDEGDRRRQLFEWQTDVGKKIFDMGTMTNKAVNVALIDATSESSGSQEDNLHRLATAVAAMRVLTGRRTDAWGSVAESVPAIATAWKAVVGGGLEDPNAYDKGAYDKAIAMALAAQERLGIENLQLVPQDIIQELSDKRNSSSTYQQEKNAKISELLAKTSGSVARAAVGKQLAAAGLGWIMPVEAGYQSPSTSSIFASQAKALGKLAANAGIFLGKVSDQIGDNLASLGGADIESPKKEDDYYEPANDVEDLMMHQGSDAATWALGEGVGKGIAGAIEWLGSGAAGQAERSIGGLEAANTPTSQFAPGQSGVGHDTAALKPATPQPEDFSRQPTTSSDAAGALPSADSNALSGATPPNPAHGGRQTNHSPRKSKVDREMVAAVARDLFARDPARVEHPGGKFGEATTNDYRKGYAQANPGVDIKKLVIHHPAEQQLLKRILEFLSEKKINSVENLRGSQKK